MLGRGGEQVGLEPDVEEDRVGVELRGEFRVRGRVGMDARERPPDRLCRGDVITRTDLQSGFESGFCVAGDFTPYRTPK